MTERLYFFCDLVDDAAAISAYEQYHAPGAVWPEVLKSIREAGIQSMEIFRAGNRLVMVMEVDDRFDPTAKAEADAANEVVQSWERKMDAFQRRLPFAPNGEKWVQAHRIFYTEA